MKGKKAMISAEYSGQSFRNELCEHIIPFWSSLKDEKNGGFCGYVGYNLERDFFADKGCILHSRILWFFSNAYMLLGDEKLLDNAKHAYQFISEHCLDNELGGIFWTVTYDGRPADTTKHTYNQAFAVYALSSYSIASGDKSALEKAKKIYDIIESRCKDSGGYLEAFTRQWNTESNEKLSENGVMASRTMNTLLHVIEAYTELLRAERSENVAASLKAALDAVAEKIYNPSKKRLDVFFDMETRPIIDLHSYGHDIEAAWLLGRACQVLDDEITSARLRTICDSLEDNILSCAFTGECLLNECCEGEVNDLRVWWVQCEAVISFYNAWQKHPEREDYLAASKAVWSFTMEHVIDKRPGGEWYSQLLSSNVPDADKETVGEWKCPYHNGRMCIEMLRRISGEQKPF